MQAYLTLLFDLIFATGGGYVIIGFLLGLLDLWQRCSPDQRAIAPAAATPEADVTPETKVPLEPIPMGKLKRSEVEKTQALVDEAG